MNNYVPTIIAAEYRGDFTVEFEFDNGVRRIINCMKYLRGQIFEPLKNESYFKRFFVDGQTIAWPNGADIAPDTLYEDSEPN